MELLKERLRAEYATLLPDDTLDDIAAECYGSARSLGVPDVRTRAEQLARARIEAYVLAPFRRSQESANHLT